MPLTLDQVSSFADSPNTQAVTAYFFDQSIVIIESMSGVNYILPPGYGDTSGLNDAKHKTAMIARTARMRAELAIQLAQ